MATSTALIALLLCTYLLGSVSGSLLLGRIRGVDIRQQGSGNAGGSNALRTQGWRFALGVIVIDVGKGALAVWLASHWLWPLSVGADAAQWLALFAAVAGHVWPVFYGFRGGKGVGTLLGGLLLLWPIGFAVFMLVALVVLVLSGYVGLASVLGALALAIAALLWSPSAAQALPAAVMALGILFTHRHNLLRLARGTENRFERIRMFRRRPRSTSNRSSSDRPSSDRPAS